MGETHQRHRLRAGAGARLQQSTQIGVALGHNTRERRRNLGIIEERLVVHSLRLRQFQLTLRRFETGLGGLHLRFCRQIFALRVIHFLLRHQAGFGLSNAIQPVELKVQHFVLRLYPVLLLLRTCYLVASVLDRGVVLLQLQLELRDLEHGHELTGLYAGSVIDVQFLYIAGFLRIHVDFLERNQFGRQGELVAERLDADFYHSYRHGLRRHLGGALCLSVPVAARRQKGGAERQQKKNQRQRGCLAVPIT